MVRFSFLNDVLFKIVFGEKSNLPALRGLLNSLLELSGDRRIQELELLSPFLGKEREAEKGAILDVRVRDGQRRQYNIEVQVVPRQACVQRALYYLARLFGDQLDAGESYERLAKTIGISLLDYALFPELEDLHSRYRLFDERHGRELTDLLELHFIELSKFRHDKPHELQTPFEKWLHLLKFGELYEAELCPLPETLKREEGIEMALTAMRKARASDEVRELIEMREKAMHDWATEHEHAKQEGLEQGLEQGLKQGREEEREQGRQRLLATARRLRETGMTTETIAQVTGLPPEDLEP